MVCLSTLNIVHGQAHYMRKILVYNQSGKVGMFATRGLPGLARLPPLGTVRDLLGKISAMPKLLWHTCQGVANLPRGGALKYD